MDIDYDLGCEFVNNLEHWTGYNSGCNVRIMKTLADRLNQRMAEIGMTQDRLGELAGVSQTTIFKLCSGKAKETRKLLAISDALGVSPKWLQHGDGPMRDAAISPESHGLPHPTDDEFAMVPQLDIAASCGHGCYVDHVIVTREPASAGFFVSA